MKCPFGHGNLLKERILEIEIDYCPLCGGIFFDKEEFKIISKLDIISERKESEYRISCPSCSSDMYIFTHPLLPLNSFAFYCKKCGGIFVPKETMRVSLKSIEEKIIKKEEIEKIISILFLDKINKSINKNFISNLICPFDGNALKIYEIKNEFGKIVSFERCNYCGGLFFKRGISYSVDKQEISKIDDESIMGDEVHGKIPICPLCNKEMRNYVNPSIKIKGIFICPSCYGMWFERGKIKDFKNFIESRKRKFISPHEQVAIEIIKKLGPEKAEPYLDVIYSDLKKKVSMEEATPSLSYFTFLSFIFPFLPNPLKVILFFLEDIIHSIWEHFKSSNFND